MEYGVWAYSSSPVSANGPLAVRTRMNRTGTTSVPKHIEGGTQTLTQQFLLHAEFVRQCCSTR